MADKRIIELTNEAMNHSNDDYLAIDSSSSGTRKIKADALLAGVAKQADLAAEKAAREAADDALKADLSEIVPGLSDEAKVALLACFANVAWINEDGQTYYDNLEAALYDDYPKITATFAPGSNTIYTDDDLDTLKQYLTVKYYTSKTDTGTTILAASYTLSGVLREGENAVRVTYLDDYKATFIVNAVDFYNQHIFSYPSSELDARIGNSSIDATTQQLGTNPNIKYRKIVFAKKGMVSYYDTVSGENIDAYPIPVPSDATSITVSYDVGVVWCAVNVLEYNGNNYSLLQDLGSFGYEGGNTKSLPSGENRFVTLVFGQPRQPNNVTFEGTDLPQSVTITFN